MPLKGEPEKRGYLGSFGEDWRVEEILRYSHTMNYQIRASAK